MIRVLIIEDEKPATAKLRSLLGALDIRTVIVGEVGSVRDSLAWLMANSHPDVIIADIGLSDGVSLDIFRQITVQCPVIFTTAYDEYILQALECNGIDYLLKPINQEKLETALRKYMALRQHFTADLTSLMQQLTSAPTQEYKRRLLVRKGIEYISIRTEDIAYIFTENKLSFLVSTLGQKYLVDKPLSELETDLDPKLFFRANRSYILHYEAVTKFKPFGKGKIQVELLHKPPEEVIISQENATAFKEWMGK